VAVGSVLPCGWTGSRFVHLSVLWGYTDRYAENEGFEGAVSGDEVLTFSTVPSGEVWVVQSFVAYATTTDVELVVLRAHCGSDDLVLRASPYGTAYEAIAILNPVVLKAGDYLHATFESCLYGVDLYASANGYKMSVG